MGGLEKKRLPNLAATLVRRRMGGLEMPDGVRAPLLWVRRRMGGLEMRWDGVVCNSYSATIWMRGARQSG